MSRLHWYAPEPTRDRRLYDPPSRWNRYKLFHAEVMPDGSWRATDEWVWMGADCGWEWLATRPVLRWWPTGWLFDRLHRHVHTPGSW